MTDMDRVDDEKVVEIANIMGYAAKNVEELKTFRALISEMDVWDISKILFFGRTWERY